LLAKAQAAGATVMFNTPVLGLVQCCDAVCGLRLATGEIVADQVIVAAGTGAVPLLADLGFALPMLQRPGVILATQAVPPRLAPILALHGQELRQDSLGRLWLPVAAHHQADGAETLPANPQASVDAALQSLNALFQGPPILRADHWAAAFRPVPGDGLPALGPVTRGLWLAVLHSGVTLGPLVAETLAAEVLGARASPLLSPFRPARFWP
jgi:glycine/D-amino acid oxidase-like deaminating enzyme